MHSLALRVLFCFLISEDLSVPPPVPLCQVLSQFPDMDKFLIDTIDDTSSQTGTSENKSDKT